MTVQKKLLEQKIMQLVVNKFNLDIDPRNISVEQSLIELGVGVDSVSTLEFILELEEEFGISIDESEVSPQVLDTIDNLSQFILSLQ